jgi:hypothetical protein
MKTASARKLLAAPASSGRERLGESSDRGGEICGQRNVAMPAPRPRLRPTELAARKLSGEKTKTHGENADQED